MINKHKNQLCKRDDNDHDNFAMPVKVFEI